MELLDIYDDSGNLIGKKIVRGDKTTILDNHEHIALAVIFIENSEGKFLMQKTSLERGGKYSSTGGHVDSGETPLDAIKREVLEEIGIDISNDDIQELGFLLYDKPLRYMFYLKKDISIDEITLQTSEVESVKYMTKEEIKKLIENNEITQSHGIIFNNVLEMTNSKSI